MSRTVSKARRIYGSPARQEWLRSLGCIVCGYSPCAICHTKSGGMGRKADFTHTVPMCFPHHREQHQMGTKSFEARYGVNLTALAEHTEAAWRRREEG